MARPTKYNATEHPKVARQLTGMGKTIRDVAKLLGVNSDTINEWRKVHPEFSVAIELGRDDAVDAVERALWERATGFTHPSEKVVVVSGGEGMGSHVEKVPITVQYPPDTAAIKLLLTNKRAREWKDRTEVEHTGKLTLEQLVGEAIKPTTPPSSPPDA